MEKISHTPDYTGQFADKRFEARASKIAHALLMSRTSSVHSSTENESEQKGFYRFLDNDRVAEGDLISELVTRCGKNVSGRDVLVIQDTSSVGLSHHSKGIKKNSGIGLVGNKVGLGFLTHCSLVLDAQNESMMGFCDVQLWHRTEDKANNTTGRYKREPIEEKESYKWIKASNNAKEHLSCAKSITIVQDREGDIYQQFCEIADERTHLVIRSRDNRKLKDGSKLHDVLGQSPVLGEYTIPIYKDTRKDRLKRIAQVEVKSCEISITKPRNVANKDLPLHYTLHAVEVKEKDRKGKDALCWRLLTTKKVDSYEKALEIIEIYKQRWYIEQLFRLLKKQGYRIEDTQLESGWSIRKLFVLVLNSALRVFQLYMAYGEEDSQPASEVFDEMEIECLKMIEKKHITKTDNTINPFNVTKLSWASWIIARLGGWKGNSKQRKAGPILLKRGLEKFEAMYVGWKLANTKSL